MRARLAKALRERQDLTFVNRFTEKLLSIMKNTPNMYLIGSSSGKNGIRILLNAVCQRCMSFCQGSLWFTP